MFTRINKKDEKGFTLIELMIVIAIIGILAAIAIPQFNAYRARSYNAGSNTDIRNIMTAQEAYFIDHDTYSAAIADLTAGYGVQVSDGVECSVIAAGDTTYSAKTYNTKAGDDYAVTYSVVGPDPGTIIKTTP